MSSAKTITLSAETISEVCMSFSSRRAWLNDILKEAVELDVPSTPSWKDRIASVEAAESEFLNAVDNATGSESKYADWYHLLRRMVLAQIKGDYEAGERFNLIIQEHGAPNNEAGFDKFMELAAKAMGARA